MIWKITRLPYAVVVLFMASYFMILSFAGTGGAVPVVPNESLIVGVVSEYSITSSRLFEMKPDEKLYAVIVTIESSTSVGQSADMLRNKIGKDVRLLSRKILSPELFSRRIKARVKFMGDERGGVYWIHDIELQ